MEATSAAFPLDTPCLFRHNEVMTTYPLPLDDDGFVIEDDNPFGFIVEPDDEDDDR